MASRRAAVLVAAIAVLAPARAVAQPAEPLEFHWDAPAPCPGERQVKDRIRKLAGSARSTDVPVRAEATVTKTEEGPFHLELVVHAGELVGARSIDGRSCEDLAGAAAVALALLLRSPEPLSEDALAGHDAGDANGAAGGAGEPSEAPHDPEKDRASSPEHAPARKSETAPAERSRRDERGESRRLHLLLRAPLGAVALGPLPKPGLGVAVAAGIAFERLRVQVDASAWKSQRMTANDDPGTGANLQRVAGGLQACWALSPGRFEVAPCVTLGLEHLRSRGEGDHIAPRTGSVTWLAAGVGLHARWRLLTWFGLFGGVNGQIEGSRPHVAIDGVGVLGRMWPASLTVTLGPEWIL